MKERTRKVSNHVRLLPKAYSTNKKFMEVWGMWIQDRAKKVAVSRNAAKLAIKKLCAAHGDDSKAAASSVQQSVEMGWRGIFPIRPKQTKSSAPTTKRPTQRNYIAIAWREVTGHDKMTVAEQEQACRIAEGVHRYQKTLPGPIHWDERPTPLYFFQNPIALERRYADFIVSTCAGWRELSLAGLQVGGKIWQRFVRMLSEETETEFPEGGGIDASATATD